MLGYGGAYNALRLRFFSREANDQSDGACESSLICHLCSGALAFSLLGMVVSASSMNFGVKQTPNVAQAAMLMISKIGNFSMLVGKVVLTEAAATSFHQFGASGCCVWLR